MRVGTALEAADASDRHAARGGKMVGAGLPGARRRRTDHFENVPLGLGMNREAMLASIRNGAEAGLGRDLLATQLAESEHVSQPPGSPGMHGRLA